MRKRIISALAAAVVLGLSLGVSLLGTKPASAQLSTDRSTATALTNEVQLNYRVIDYGPVDFWQIDYMRAGPGTIPTDVNGDGLTDLFLSPSAILIQNPTTHMLEFRSAQLQVPGLMWASEDMPWDRRPIVADLDQDGDADIVYENKGDFGRPEDSGTVDVLSQTAPLVFGNRQHYDFQWVDLASGTVKDFDDDGYPDLLISRYYSEKPVENEVAVYLNDGKGHFGPDQFNFSTGEHLPNGGWVDMADFNGDGKNDLFLNYRGLYIWQSPDYASPPLKISDMVGPLLYGGNFDNDGKDDVVGSCLGFLCGRVLWGGTTGLTDVTVLYDDQPCDYSDCSEVGYDYIFGNVDAEGDQDELLAVSFDKREIVISDSRDRKVEVRQIVGLPQYLKNQARRWILWDLHVADYNNDGKPDISVLAYPEYADGSTGKDRVLVFYQEGIRSSVFFPTVLNTMEGAIPFQP